MKNARLDGCYSKAQRASEHVEPLNEARTECLTAKFLQATVTEEGGVCFAKLSVVAPPSPRVSNIVGDVVHNLRSALDHLACAMVEASGGAVHRQTQFPVAETRERFERLRQTQLSASTPEMLSLVERLQPYNSRPASAHPLHIINRLDIKDKHQGLLIAAVLPQRVILRSRTDERAFVDVKFNEGLPFPMNVGDELVRFRLRPGTQRSDVNVDVQVAADMALVEEPPIHRTPIVFACHDLVEFLYKEVLLYASPLLMKR